MSEVVRSGQRNLKRIKTKRMPVADPLQLFYAGIGYLGVIYESHLVYLKQELEKDFSGSENVLVTSLESVRGFMQNVAASQPAGVPLNRTVREFVQANQPAIQQLAAEGKGLMERIEEERRKR
jgi:hypothetical protein